MVHTYLNCAGVPWQPLDEKPKKPLRHVSHRRPVTPGLQGPHPPPKAVQVRLMSRVPTGSQSQAEVESSKYNHYICIIEGLKKTTLQRVVSLELSGECEGQVLALDSTNGIGGSRSRETGIHQLLHWLTSDGGIVGTGHRHIRK